MVFHSNTPDSTRGSPYSPLCVPSQFVYLSTASSVKTMRSAHERRGFQGHNPADLRARMTAMVHSCQGTDPQVFGNFEELNVLDA